MASFLPSPVLLSHALAKPQLSCSQAPPPPQQPPSSSSSPRPSPPSLNASPLPRSKPVPTKAESTDWVASSLTRRFGIGAGLGWVAFLAFGVVSEQIKTRFEVSQQEANTKDVEKEEEVLLPNGIRYYELRVGGGATPRTGDLVVLDLQGRVSGSSQPFVDTLGGETKRPLALVMGSRPYTRGMCEGVESVLKTMRAGGRRRVVVPPSFGFGDDGADFGTGVKVEGGATLEYVVQESKIGYGIKAAYQAGYYSSELLFMGHYSQ